MGQGPLHGTTLSLALICTSLNYTLTSAAACDCLLHRQLAYRWYGDAAAYPWPPTLHAAVVAAAAEQQAGGAATAAAAVSATTSDTHSTELATGHTSVAAPAAIAAEASGAGCGPHKGSGSAPQLFVERKKHRDAWTGEFSVKVCAASTVS